MLCSGVIFLPGIGVLAPGLTQNEVPLKMELVGFYSNSNFP